MRERQIPGIMGNLWCRTRFIDDTFREAMAAGFEQLVVLGAGLDTRAYRLVDDADVVVFEVDHPSTQAWKRAAIERLAPDRASRVRFVPVDFDRDDLGGAMAAAGFRPGIRTLFIWEGVTQYLTDAAIDATLRVISDSAAPTSRLVFTYIDRAIIDGSTTRPISDALQSELERHGEPWRFGIDPGRLMDFLAARGLELVEDVGADDYRSRYLEPFGREMNLFRGERVAIATVLAVDDDAVS
jgi:methyltransferase (TIGR00027 family)